jgi:hypothetical protein
MRGHLVFGVNSEGEQNMYTSGKETQAGQAVSQEQAVTKVENEPEGKSEGRLPALVSELAPMHMMAGMQAMMSAPGRWKDGERDKNLLAAGAVDLYRQLAPADAIETVLSMLIVGVSSASADCLAQAASTHPDYLERRDLNLRHGLKGAAVAADLIKALDARRGNPEPRNVTVRDVNVEAGAQAIIGSVEAPRRKDRLEPRGAEVLAQPDEPELEGENR